jgi:hypothetical protein
VKNYGVAINVYSEPGKGTTFHAYLRRVEDSTEPEVVDSEALPTGYERILFVDAASYRDIFDQKMYESAASYSNYLVHRFQGFYR